ncbi:hypothetical protein EDEG_03782 [Edhazardia aedis USNM 41457]|uniref:Uncharacterized protein n=1 Tax=Edhazardia aedis (strain USNM 41457) TaxID=1003232 RepID=J9D286_EDHAE|nr:hypothetical protein EDEG_03782 [Edhazardia aedis USNM 41457]|eukprot:EJW01689.1 hypothetical protein EDEG_03782 [Edhazardia aedis USNM 41457]
MNTLPAKIILFGEHSVLKGHKCIAAAINILSKQELVNDRVENNYCVVKDTVGNVFDISEYTKNTNMTINLGTRLGSGLGSSAVISVFLSQYFKNNPQKIGSKIESLLDETNKKIICDDTIDLARRIEDNFHGKSSGIDVAIVKTCGVIVFQNGRFRTIVSDHLNKYKFIIFDSGLKKDTKQIYLSKKPKDDTFFDKMNEIAVKAEKLIQNDFSLKDLYPLLRENHEMLRELGVVPEIMHNEVLKLRKMGIEAKITGAGCGGFLFTFVEKDVNIDNWTEVKIFKCD